MHAFGSSRATGRRTAPRAGASLVVVLSTTAGDHPAALVDISRTGARVKGQLLPTFGDEMNFRAEEVEVRGEIVWSIGDICAIEFDTPIAAEEVKKLQQLAGGAKLG